MIVQRLMSLAVSAVVVLDAAIAWSQVIEVAATETDIVLSLREPMDGTVSVSTATVDEEDAAAFKRPPAWTGVPQGRTITLPRFDGATDRLFHRVLLADATGQTIGSPRYVTDLSGLKQRAGELPRPTSPKGLQCIVDLDDAIALGVKHAAVNVSLSQLFDPQGTSPIRRDVDGVPVAAREAVIARLDAAVKRMTDAGMRVNLILLNHLGFSRPDSPLRHPKTDPAAPNGIGAFNLTNAEGVRTFRGLIELLAERYSRDDAAHGLVAGYIVGNEVQSHFDWYNLGDAEPSNVVAEYADAVRVADLAVRRFHPEARVFASFDHHWSRQHRDEATRSMPGRVLLDRLHATLAEHGDVPWGVAFHPYPENLGNPRTWQDKTATLCYDTPRITFKNLEVLTTYLRQPRLLSDGEPRRLILSEQGFHCLTSDDGETLQAAAYAYAFERIRRIDGFESFIYHRHVDHPHEGGLRLGLRENVPGTTDQPGRVRTIADLFRVIDSPDGPAATEFAKPIVGVTTWDDLGPRPVEPSCR